MVRNTHKLLVSLILFTTTASANVIITDPVHLDLDNGAWITLKPQTIYGTGFNLYNNTGSPASSVRIFINGTEIIFTAQANKTLSNLSYTVISDTFTWNGTGNYGYLNITAKMFNATTNYSLKVNASIYQNDTSDIQGWAIFNYPEADAHFFEILQTGIFIPPVGVNKTIITFTDTTCLNIGVLCDSEIKVIKDGKIIGDIKAQDDYIQIPAGGNITLSLKPSKMKLLNNNELMNEWLKRNWGLLFSGLLGIGLLSSTFYIIKR